ncbi:MAG: RNA polymerase sigma factor [Phaeodactylibacter sp.]|nr:RNA polymerase sigma factor [Phaeodactylibacter sp.]
MKKEKTIKESNRGIQVPTKVNEPYSGNEAAVNNKIKETLYERRTYEQLHSLITSIIKRNGFRFRNAETTEDVVHDVMLSFLRTIDDESINDITDLIKAIEVIDFKKGYPESLKGYICQKTKNRCIDIFRYEKRRKYATPEDVSPVNWPQYWDDWVRWASWKPGTEIELEAPDQKDAPKRLPRFSVSEKEQPTVDKLSLEEVLNMLTEYGRPVFNLFYEGYEHEEIAKILGIRSATSRKRLQRARVRLQSQFPEEFATEWK